MRVATARLPGWPEAPHYPARLELRYPLRVRLGQAASPPTYWTPLAPRSVPAPAPPAHAPSSVVVPIVLGLGALGLFLVGVAGGVRTPRARAGLGVGTLVLAGGAAWWAIAKPSGLGPASPPPPVTITPSLSAAALEARVPASKLSVHLIIPPGGSAPYPAYLAVVLPPAVPTPPAASGLGDWLSFGLGQGPSTGVGMRVAITPLDGTTLSAFTQSLGLSAPSTSTWLSWGGTVAAKALSLAGQAAASTGVGLAFAVGSAIAEGTTIGYWRTGAAIIGALLGGIAGPAGAAVGAFLLGKAGAAIGRYFSTTAEQIALGQMIKPVSAAEAAAFKAQLKEITTYQEALVTDPMLAESMASANPSLPATVGISPAGTMVAFPDGSSATSMGGGFSVNSDGTISNALGEVTGATATSASAAPPPATYQPVYTPGVFTNQLPWSAEVARQMAEPAAPAPDTSLYTPGMFTSQFPAPEPPPSPEPAPVLSPPLQDATPPVPIQAAAPAPETTDVTGQPVLPAVQVPVPAPPPAAAPPPVLSAEELDIADCTAALAKAGWSAGSCIGLRTGKLISIGV